MTHWSKIPFFRFLIPLITGIVICYFLNCPFIIPYIALLIAIAFLLIVHKKINGVYSYSWRWVFGVLINLIFIGIGYKLTELTFQLRNENHFSNIDSTPLVYYAEVTDQPVEKERTYRLILNISKIQNDEGTTSVLGKVVCYLKKDSQLQIPQYGDEILFSKPPQRIEKPGNPGEFDYAGFLENKQIYHTLSLKSNDFIIISIGNGSHLKHFAFNIRDKILNTLNRFLQDRPDEYKIAEAILTGQSKLSEHQQEMYSDAGVIHILCVSGLHVGVIYLMTEFLLSFLNRRTTFLFIKPTLVLVVIWLYALITGLSVPVMRASMMFSLLLIGKTLRMQTNSYNILAASAFILLILDPRSLFNVGFQLSFAAVTGILVLKNPITKLWASQNPILSKIWDLIAISLAAQIFITPLILYYFHKFPIYFIIANLIAVPLSAFIIYTGAALLITSSIPFVSVVFSWLFMSEIKFLNLFVTFINNLPGAIIRNIHISLFSCIVLSLMLIFAAALNINEKRNYIWPVLICLLILGVNAGVRNAEVSNQRMIIFHKINSHTLISFIEGTHQIILTDSILNKNLSPALYYLDGLTVEAGIKECVVKCTSKSDVNSYSVPEFCQFLGKRIALLSSNCILPKANIKNVDYVLLCNNPPLRLNDIKGSFPGAIIITDNTCSQWKIEEYKKELTSAGSFYNLKKEGALVVNL